MSVFLTVSDGGGHWDPARNSHVLIDFIFCWQLWDLDQREQQYCGRLYHNPDRLQFDPDQTHTCWLEFLLFTRGIKKQLFYPKTTSECNYFCVRNLLWNLFFKPIVGVVTATCFAWMLWKANHLHITICSIFRANFKCVACRLPGIAILMGSSVYSIWQNINIRNLIKCT